MPTWPRVSGFSMSSWLCLSCILKKHLLTLALSMMTSSVASESRKIFMYMYTLFNFLACLIFCFYTMKHLIYGHFDTK